MTNEDKILLTKEGLEALKKEYKNLVEKRPKIVERLTESRQAGDLAENSEYIQAKEELSFIDGRITEIKDTLSKVVLINHDHKNCSQINLGCKVIVNTKNNGNQIFYLVGEWEVNPSRGKISYTSPLGKALLGKKIGDIVEVEAPAGKIIYTIAKIE